MNNDDSFDGMTKRPLGCDDPIMMGAVIGCVHYCAGEPDMLARFQKDTGKNLLEAAKATGIDKAIDAATGRTKDTVMAWADWVAENVWGLEDAPKEALTVEALRAARNALREITQEPIPVGMALSPAAHSKLVRSTSNLPLVESLGMLYGGIQSIIDPRMCGEKTEVYFDDIEWRVRCAEQRDFDGKAL